jgi:hypothetical protein
MWVVTIKSAGDFHRTEADERPVVSLSRLALRYIHLLLFLDIRTLGSDWGWWCTPKILELRRVRQKDPSSRPEGATY